MLEQDEVIKPEKIPVGVSSCLLGERVRYDGGHKGHSYITGTLHEYFDYQPFCPELNIGLGVPRKPIRLQRADADLIRCVQIDDASIDHTQSLRDCADEQRTWQSKLCGYIVKKDSPSCGMERVKVWQDAMPVRSGSGVYTQRMLQNFPFLPVEEEGRLGDAVLRENFIQRVFALRRWHHLMESLTVGSLIEFHARHKLILMSRNQSRYRKLGQFVAAINQDNLEAKSAEYLLEFMALLKISATRKHHVNVLQHIQGYLKKNLDSDDKQELAQSIEKYRLGLVPIVVPITLLNHHFRRHPDAYITDSYYMSPYPEELCLQNTI